MRGPRICGGGPRLIYGRSVGGCIFPLRGSVRYFNLASCFGGVVFWSRV